MTVTRDSAVSGSTSRNQLSTNYGYDDAGNVSSATTTSGASATDIQCFKYDHLANLTQAFAPSGSCAAAPTAAGLGGRV